MDGGMMDALNITVGLATVALVVGAAAVGFAHENEMSRADQAIGYALQHGYIDEDAALRQWEEVRLRQAPPALSEVDHGA